MIKKIYVYLVSFATLMMVIGGGIATFAAAANLIAPSSYSMSYTDYIQNYYMKYDEKGERVDTKGLSKEELQVEYETYLEKEEELEKKRNLNSLVQSLGWVLIPLPIFLFTQRKLRDEKDENEEGK